MVTPRGPRSRPLAEVSRQRARLAAAQADVAEIKAAKARGELLDAEAVAAEWSAILRGVCAGMLAVPSQWRNGCPTSPRMMRRRSTARCARCWPRSAGRVNLAAAGIQP